MTPIKEICVESFEEALCAAAAGASRIELCDNLSVGGTTPSLGTIKRCQEKITVPVMVMIRPRGGNFCYSAEEFDIMKDDILVCKKLNVKGVVFGILDETGCIDKERTREFVQFSRPMEVTFHKAIDQARDILEAVSFLKEIGVERILSSGGKETALEGAETLRQMIRLAAPQLTIIVAGKVTKENFESVQSHIPSNEFHGRKLIDF